MRLVTRVTCMAVILTATTARAQETPSIELSGGYQVLRSGIGPGSIGTTYPVGWQASIGVNLNAWLGVAASAGADIRNVSNSIANAVTSTTTTSQSAVYSFMAGPQLTKRVSTTVDVFTSVMFGVIHSSVNASLSSTEIFAPNTQLELSVSGGTTRFAWQPGAGIDVSMTRRWAIRLGANYRILQWSPNEGQLQAVTAIVFRP